ncbi:KipI family sensor histidine kinase inhibitor [Thermocatellispora tengchongensis]|uniref:KipI family sensor histidine kinase inhibitor n=1 Tax=Thermocatellispora tengchongensis TaxID=1073253 RepID=A0A840P692_9ACTN|nr:allophanate hydrolase subunit 1 [Thermocatellispora tengchongensis]MBB5135188.1 KipI family sensor histidine kinase inhibitor [Thermocatellispora tengchongensis]
MTTPAGEGAVPIHRAGEHALLVETGGLAASHRLDALLRAERPPGVTEIVPGPATVLVVAPGADPVGLRARLSALAAAATARQEAGTAAAAPLVRVPVTFDGADLADVAALTGLGPQEVIARFCGSEFVAGWLGFAPGFAYLTGLDPALRVPRLDTPRTCVPAGAVAVAGPYAAVYPAASPGGWRLLGHTTLRVWDTGADPPALLRPGTRVRFEAAVP